MGKFTQPHHKRQQFGPSPLSEELLTSPVARKAEVRSLRKALLHKPLKPPGVPCIAQEERELVITLWPMRVEMNPAQRAKLRWLRTQVIGNVRFTEEDLQWLKDQIASWDKR